MKRILCVNGQNELSVWGGGVLKYEAPGKKKKEKINLGVIYEFLQNPPITFWSLLGDDGSLELEPKGEPIPMAACPTSEKTGKKKKKKVPEYDTPNQLQYNNMEKRRKSFIITRANIGKHFF